MPVDNKYKICDDEKSVCYSSSDSRLDVGYLIANVIVRSVEEGNYVDNHKIGAYEINKHA